MQTVSFAGDSYNIPTVRGDRPWSGLSDFVIAAASKAINTAGGNFTLLADINFGATFGLVSTYYKSRSANIATAGHLRLANADSIQWRNAANGANLSLALSTNTLQFNGSSLLLAGLGSIVNADINASAAIAFSKMAALTADRALVSTGGVVTVATTTATEIGYVNGVTSAIQTQIDAKAADNAVVKLTGDQTIAGNKTFSDPIVQNDTSNQIVLGVTNTTTISATAPAASRVVTIPDPGAAASFVMTEGTQTVNGAKTLSDLRGTLGANLAAGGFKLTGLGAGSAAGESIRFEQLKVLQYVIATSTTDFSTTSNSFQTSNLSASITPSSASNKVLVIYSGGLQSDSINNVQTFVTVARGGSNLLGTQGHGAMVSRVAATWQTVVSGAYVDAPASTSALTYAVQIRNGDGTTTIHFGQSASTTQFIILAELAG